LPGFAGAEDVVQQTFISVSQNHDQFDPKLKFGNWIFSIAANFAVNMRVALSRRPALSIEDLLKSDPKGRALVPSQLEDSREHSPEYDVFAAERNERLRLLLDELPEQHRIVMERLFFQNMTCEEAAADLNMPLGTVKTRLRWSLSRLREATAEDQELYRAA
jgi:RNA polymerase sigma-70 factor (ECF subfamily)